MGATAHPVSQQNREAQSRTPTLGPSVVFYLKEIHGNREAGETAQCVEGLLSKCEDHELDIQNSHEIWSWRRMSIVPEFGGRHGDPRGLMSSQSS